MWEISYGTDFVCVCVSEREREGGRERESARKRVKENVWQAQYNYNII